MLIIEIAAGILLALFVLWLIANTDWHTPTREEREAAKARAAEWAKLAKEIKAADRRD